MLPFVQLTDEVITLRPFEFGEAEPLYRAVHESLAMLRPWMSWATDAYDLETAKNFITVTRAQWSSGALYAFAIIDAKTNEVLGGSSLSHLHPIYHFCN